MKKILSVVLALALLLALTACGTASAPSATEEPAATEAPAAEAQSFSVGICQLVQHPALDKGNHHCRRFLHPARRDP